MPIYDMPVDHAAELSQARREKLITAVMADPTVKMVRFLSRSLACTNCEGAVHESGPEIGYTIRKNGNVLGYLCYSCGQRQLELT